MGLVGCNLDHKINICGTRTQRIPHLNTHRAHPRLLLVTATHGDTSPNNASQPEPQNNNDSASPLLLSPTRRTLLSGICVGSMHATGVRGMTPGAAFSAATYDTNITSSTNNNSTAALQRRLEKNVHEFTLSNGMKFIVSQRSGTAPIVSCHTYADVGAFDEKDGQTGIAHLLEHLAFKGTATIGTTNYLKEAELLDAIDEVFYDLLAAPNGREAARLTERLDTLQAEASKYSVTNAYGSLLSRQGAVGLNAVTSHDATKYFCSLPVNKLELWFALESQRFQYPVFRELYSEKKVVTEERKMRVDNSPLGPFQEAFAEKSFNNNYRRPVIGYQRDIDRLGRREVHQFFTERYGPQNLTVCIAGEVSPEVVRDFAEKYFGGWKNSSTILSPACVGLPDGAAAAAAFLSVNGGGNGSVVGGGTSSSYPYSDINTLKREGSTSNTSRTVQQKRRYESRSRAGPAVMRSFYRPCINHPDALPLDVASDILSGSRLSRFYRNIVQTNNALAVTSFSSLPGDKHPCQFFIYGKPVDGQSTTDSLDQAMLHEIETLAERGPTQEELTRVVKSTRMSLLNVLTSNSSLAGALASYSVLTGDWRNVGAELQRLDGLTTEDVKGVVGRYLTKENSFVGVVQKG